MIGKLRDPQSSEDAKGKIEAVDEDSRRPAHRTGGNAEIGDEPERIGIERGDDPQDKLVQLRLREAIEKEVRNDEIIAAV